MGELSKLEWRCRRGTKELDLLLLGYLNRNYMHAELHLKKAFESLLEMQDPELYELLIDKAQADNKDIADVVAIIRSRHHD